MKRKHISFLIILGFSIVSARSQSFVKTSELFTKSENNLSAGNINVIQDQALDTLISRYILANKNIGQKNGYVGMEGFRIQIYNSSSRNAREESGKVKAEFISKFPDIKAYELFENPGYFKIRVGDFRSKTEATRLFLLISKEFPDAYMVPDYINFPDQNTK
jgi:hypothetical protein